MKRAASELLTNEDGIEKTLKQGIFIINLFFFLLIADIYKKNHRFSSPC